MIAVTTSYSRWHTHVAGEGTEPHALKSKGAHLCCLLRLDTEDLRKRLASGRPCQVSPLTSQIEHEAIAHGRHGRVAQDVPRTVLR